jgi:hypothetical protein
LIGRRGRDGKLDDENGGGKHIPFYPFRREASL